MLKTQRLWNYAVSCVQRKIKDLPIYWHSDDSTWICWTKIYKMVHNHKFNHNIKIICVFDCISVERICQKKFTMSRKGIQSQATFCLFIPWLPFKPCIEFYNKKFLSNLFLLLNESYSFWIFLQYTTWEKFFFFLHCNLFDVWFEISIVPPK